MFCYTNTQKVGISKSYAEQYKVDIVYKSLDENVVINMTRNDA